MALVGNILLGTGGTVGDEDIIGTGASSVVSLGSAIELYGIYP